MKKNAGFEKFTGLYCSGFFIPDPSMLTMLSLLFDNFYLANNLEYIIDFVKKYKFKFDTSLLQKANNMVINPYENDTDEILEDPFVDLTEKELETAKQYLYLSRHFYLKNHELIGKVIKTTMLPDDEILGVELVQKGQKGAKNLYRVSEKPLIVSLDGLTQFNDLLDDGAIPVIGKYHVGTYTQSKGSMPSKYLACLLAMKSIKLVLPAMKKAEPETILEARDKLHDQLPLFWSSMLKLSVELRNNIRDNMNESDVIFETQEIVDTTVRPAIIELKQKLEMDRKNWFYKILHPVYDGVKMLIGNPQMTTSGLAYAGLTTGLNIANSFACQAEEVNKIKKEAGLTFLLRMDELIKK